MKTNRARIARHAGRLLLLLAAAFPAAAPSRAQAIRDVFEKVKDSVVVVHTAEKRFVEGQLLADEGMGSGVLVDREGLVLTAAHVVQVAEKIVVEMADGQTVPARVAASSPAADVALLRLAQPVPNAVVAKLGDSDQARVGDEVFIVGAPLGITHTLTVGHISARRQLNSMIGGMGKVEFLQTDAAVNPGNSGGPMFNLSGEVIGLVSHMISQTGSFAGLGFAASSNAARRMAFETPAVWTGIDGILLTGPLAQIFNLPQPVGLLIQRVAANSPGERMGLRGGTIQAQIEGEDILLGGDILLEIQSIPLSDPDAATKIQAALSRIQPGEKLIVVLLREGRRLPLSGVPSPR